ncbi:putative WavE lipopolysaccharide synthesis [Burkholderia cepacia]|uniref:WavE lipopolysaccharide synthesis family protein n=1 Tax=Burkholderia cepacia TaxID=292 RepID=UPI0039A43A64
MLTSEIDDDDITIVFQGSWNASLCENIERTREVLPRAMMVIGSTDPRVLDMVTSAQVVVVPDPGALPAYKRGRNKPENNVNRQIVSSHAGLAHVRTRYAVKIRTDCSIRDRGFVELYGRMVRESGSCARLLANSIYTLHPDGIEALPFHISDWFFFGETAVLRDYFDIPLMLQRDACWYAEADHDIQANNFARQYKSRFAPEQYMAIENARKAGYVVPKYLSDTRDEVVDSYIRFLVDKFIICDLTKFGLFFEKYKRATKSNFQFFNCVWGSDWSSFIGREKDSKVSAKLELIDKGPPLGQRRMVVSWIRRLDRLLDLLRACGLMPLIGDVLGFVRRLNYRG